MTRTTLLLVVSQLTKSCFIESAQALKCSVWSPAGTWPGLGGPAKEKRARRTGSLSIAESSFRDDSDSPGFLGDRLPGRTEDETAHARGRSAGHGHSKSLSSISLNSQTESSESEDSDSHPDEAGATPASPPSEEEHVDLMTIAFPGARAAPPRPAAGVLAGRGHGRAEQRPAGGSRSRSRTRTPIRSRPPAASLLAASPTSGGNHEDSDAAREEQVDDVAKRVEKIGQEMIKNEDSSG
ncbi:unnamed protein product [Amoebophrya sp. A120]|nr:unnamed protein product [Amoebophrya sp. A120]|eukprot:GSA120T00010484001.1